MKKFLVFLLLFIPRLPAAAMDGEHVKYVGGTSATVNAGVAGRLDLADDRSLTFHHDGRKVAIPYASIQSWNYSRETTHHLGVLPAIAIALVRARQHRHLFRITFLNPNDVPQVAVFEVPKQMTLSLTALLNARAPQGTQRRNRCHWSNWVDGRCVCDTQETVPCKPQELPSQP